MRAGLPRGLLRRLQAPEWRRPRPTSREAHSDTRRFAGKPKAYWVDRLDVATVRADFGFAPRRERGQHDKRREFAQRVRLVARVTRLVARAERIVLVQSA
jgi:hypothetical protein